MFLALIINLPIFSLWNRYFYLFYNTWFLFMIAKGILYIDQAIDCILLTLLDFKIPIRISIIHLSVRLKHLMRLILNLLVLNCTFFFLYSLIRCYLFLFLLINFNGWIIIIFFNLHIELRSPISLGFFIVLFWVLIIIRMPSKILEFI